MFLNCVHIEHEFIIIGCSLVYNPVLQKVSIFSQQELLYVGSYVAFDEANYSSISSSNSGTNWLWLLLNFFCLLLLQGALLPCMGSDAGRLPSGGEEEREDDHGHQLKYQQGLTSVGEARRER